MQPRPARESPTVFILMVSDRGTDGHGANLNNHTFECYFSLGFFLCVFVSLMGVSLHV